MINIKNRAVCSILFAVVCTTATAQELPSLARIMTQVEACAGSRSEQIDANLEGALNRWRDGLVEGKYTSRSSADFLSQFVDEANRLKAYEIYVSCIRSWPELASAKMKPSDEVKAHPSQEKSGIFLSYVNGVKNGGHLDFIFRIQNLSKSERSIYYSGLSYIDNNGSICNKGNLMRSINGISHRVKDGPSIIQPGEIIQFTDENIGCSNSTLSGIGSIKVDIDEIDKRGETKKINYLIFDVSVRK